MGTGRQGSAYTVLYNDGRALVGQKDKLIVDWTSAKTGYPSGSGDYDVSEGDKAVEFQTNKEGELKVLTLRYRSAGHKGVAKYWWQPSYETKENKNYLYGSFDVYHSGRRAWSEQNYGR